MRAKRAVLAIVVGGLTASGLVFLPTAAMAASGTVAVSSVYRTVLTAEYFGPVNAVCGNLTAAGVRSFTTAAPTEGCKAAYDQLHHVLHRKQPDNDNSGYTAKAYRSVVAEFMANLTIHVNGHWRFSSYPPTVES
jgi:hypothetical protein